MRNLWIFTLYGVYFNVGVGEHLHVLYHCLPQLPTYGYTQCVLWWCVWHWHLSFIPGPHPACHMQLEAGERGLGTKVHLWTAYYITVSVLFICCHRNWWKGVWSRHSLIWCLMWKPQYSWMLSGDSWRRGWVMVFVDSLPQRSSDCLIAHGCMLCGETSGRLVSTLSDDYSVVCASILCYLDNTQELCSYLSSTV